MTKDPKITMDTVRVAINLAAGSTLFAASIVPIRDAATLGQIANRIRRLNEDDCNIPSDDAMQAARNAKRDKLTAKAGEIARRYGATFYPYGEGGGLWPHVKLSHGGTVTP